MTPLKRFDPVKYIWGKRMPGSAEESGEGEFVKYLDAEIAIQAIGLRVACLEDTLERISAEYRLVVRPCECAAGAACPVCEITYLLDEYRDGKNRHE